MCLEPNLSFPFVDKSLDATFYFTFFINELKLFRDRFGFERLVVFLMDEVQNAFFDIQICFHTNSVGPDWNLRNADSLKEPKEAKVPRLLALEWPNDGVPELLAQRRERR